jgi:transposase
MMVDENISANARLHGIAKSTAIDLWAKWREHGTTSNLPRCGRPPKITEDTLPQAIAAATGSKANRRKPFRQIANEVDAPVCPETIRRLLAQEGYHRRVARKVPKLKPLTKKRRLAWAQERKEQGCSEFSHVIWSDEAYVILGETCGRVYVTRKSGEELEDECVEEVCTQASVRAMIWGCIMKGRKGPLVILEYPGGKGGGMNAERYREQVLEPALLPFFSEMQERVPNLLFQQDGASAHRAKATSEWLAAHNIPTFPHPPSSPDVSPIEPVWLVLKKHIRARPIQPTNYVELQQAILEAWDAIPSADTDTLIDRMPRIVDAVMASNGGHTKY